MPTTLSNSYMVCFDNLSALNQEMSDLLCMAVTGGSLSKRALFTNNDEFIISLKRKVVITGILPVAKQSDLLDRSIIIELERVPDHLQVGEEVIRQRFEKDLPDILGICFQILSKALAIVDTLTFDRLPRMADFSRYGYAIAEAMGVEGQQFMDAYTHNQKMGVSVAIEANALAQAIVAFMQNRNEWQGKASDLLETLEHVCVNQHIDKSHHSFPKSASQLSQKVKLIKVDLEVKGIGVETVPVRGGYNLIQLKKIDG